MNRLTLFTLLFGTTALLASGDKITFSKAKELALTGKGGFDYVSIDAASRRLYLAHSTKLEVVDLDKETAIGVVDGIDGAHGTALVPDLKRGYATAGKKKSLVVFDLATLKMIKEVPTGEGPDAVLYVSSMKEVWSINHRAGTITCVDASTLDVKETIDVGGTLEFAVEYPAKGLVFVNAEDKHFVAAIDAKTHKVLNKYPLAPAEGPTGLALDSKNGILFAGCDKMMAILDAATGKVIATPAIGDGCDAVAFDADQGLAFASCGDGTTTIVREVDAKTFEIAGTIQTAAGARTCAIDPKTHKLWLGSGSRGKDDVKLLCFARDAAKPADATKK